MDCGYNCHEKCQPMVPKTCTKLKAVTDTSTSAVSVAGVGGTDVSASSTGLCDLCFCVLCCLSSPIVGYHRYGN